MSIPQSAADRRPTWSYWIVFLAIVLGIGTVAAVVLAVNGSGRAQPGFLGTNARLITDINLVMQIGMGVALLIGFFFARRNNVTAHGRNQTIVVLVNLVLITFVMLSTFTEQVLPDVAAIGEPRIYLPMLHGLMGLVVQLLGLYLVLRMYHLLPHGLRVKNFKPLMHFTLVFWLATIGLGISIYAAYYAPGRRTSTPVAAATATPTLPLALPTATQPPPTGITALTFTPAPVRTRLGVVAVRDNFTYGDQLFVNLQNLPPLDEGTVYAGWLTGNRGLRRRFIGVITPDATGAAQFDYNADRDENLLARYDGFLLARQPAETPESSTGEVVAMFQVPPKAMEYLRFLLVASVVAPNETALAIGLREQMEEILRQAQLAREAVQRGDLTSFKRHAEIMVLVIEGPAGPNYGDLDGDGQALDAGDGFGLLHFGNQTGYAKAVEEAAILAAQAEDTNDSVVVHSNHVQVAARNVADWLAQLREVALTVFALTDVRAANDAMRQMFVLAERAHYGYDADNNEVIDPLPGELGSRGAYQHAQFMAEMPLTMEAEVQPMPTLPASAEVEPTAVPTPTPTSPAEGETIIYMVNFAFDPVNLTVKPGTTVKFVNLDNAPHTATADNGSFDTKTIKTSQVAELTFNAPGVYPYFCAFHGGPGLDGMAGTITVAE